MDFGQMFFNTVTMPEITDMDNKKREKKEIIINKDNGNKEKKEVIVVENPTLKKIDVNYSMLSPIYLISVFLLVFIAFFLFNKSKDYPNIFKSAKNSFKEGDTAFGYFQMFGIAPVLIISFGYCIYLVLKPLFY